MSTDQTFLRQEPESAAQIYAHAVLPRNRELVEKELKRLVNIHKKCSTLASQPTPVPHSTVELPQQITTHLTTSNMTL
jgi:hypothetical protein